MSKTTFIVNKDDLKVVMSRIFDVQREKVYTAFTDANLIPQWWGPSIYTTTIDKHDFVVGGIWRYIQRDNDGNEFAFNGVFKEIIPKTKHKFANVR